MFSLFKKSCASVPFAGVLFLSSCVAPSGTGVRDEMLKAAKKERAEAEALPRKMRQVASTVPATSKEFMPTVGSVADSIRDEKVSRLARQDALIRQMPDGVPLSPEFVAADPDLRLHRQLLSISRQLLAEDERGLEQASAINASGLKSIEQSTSGIAERNFAIGMKRGFEREASLQKSEMTSIRRFLDSLDQGIRFLEQRKGKWRVQDDQYVFEDSADVRHFNQLYESYANAAAVLAGG